MCIVLALAAVVGRGPLGLLSALGAGGLFGLGSLPSLAVLSFWSSGRRSPSHSPDGSRDSGDTQAQPKMNEITGRTSKLRIGLLTHGLDRPLSRVIRIALKLGRALHTAGSVNSSERATATQPTPRQFFPELEGMRGVAAAAVFAYHLWLVLGVGRITILGVDLTRFPANGGLGVDFFFILSGFLLAIPWLRGYEQGKPPSWAIYAQRRLFRIVPAYYASVIILAVWTAPPPPGFGTPVVTPAVLLAHAVFAPYLALKPALNGVYWSLSTEMQFYIVLPVLALAFTGRRWLWGLVGCIAVALAWRMALFLILPPKDIGLFGVDANTYLNLVALPGRVDSFAVGIVGAVLWLRYGHRKFPIAGPLAVVSGILLVSLTIHLPELWNLTSAVWWISYLLGKTLFAAGFGMVVIGAIFSTTAMVAIWRSAPLRWVGTISYSVYLWHLPLVTAFAAHWGRLEGHPTGLLAAVIIVVVLPVATVSYLCVEKPFLDGGRQFRSWIRSVRVWRPGTSS